jgi:hypothetical protein
MMSYLIPGAAFCGFIVQQAMMIAPAVKKDETTPDTFSWKYYFSRPSNQIQIIMNIAATVGAMFAHAELMAMMIKIPVVGPYFEGGTFPAITALLIGFGAAWVFRWLAYLMSKAQ